MRSTFCSRFLTGVSVFRRKPINGTYIMTLEHSYASLYFVSRGGFN